MFNIVFLTSTKQHYGLTDVDVVTLKDLFKKSHAVSKVDKLAHIKIIPGDEKIALEKTEFFKSLGFEVIQTTEYWESDHESQYLGLAKDMAKCYNHPMIKKSQFTFHLENDWVFHTDQLDSLFDNSIHILEKNPNLVYHRYSRVDQPDIIQRLSAEKKDGFYSVKREWSFNPAMLRSRDMIYISNFVLKNFKQIHPHVEMAYEIAAKYLLNQEEIFSFTDNRIVEHIGWEKQYNNFINKII
jgi:hypothetical protein